MKKSLAATLITIGIIAVAGTVFVLSGCLTEKGEYKKFESDKITLEKLVKMLNDDTFIHGICVFNDYEYRVNDAMIYFKDGRYFYELAFEKGVKNLKGTKEEFKIHTWEGKKRIEKTHLLSKKRFLEYVKEFKKINLEQIIVDDSNNTILFVYKVGYMFAYAKNIVNIKWPVGDGHVGGWNRYIEKKIIQNWYTVR